MGDEMNYKVLYRKYRPNTFDEIFDQDHTVKMLKNAIISNKISHAYLFTGPRGTGKTSSAKIFAKTINCESPIMGNPCNECVMCKMFVDTPDIIEIDAASNNGVDEIRELINNVKLAPSFSKYKVYIIDEVHMLSTSAFNALLLTLEEPPGHVVFILATTDVQNVPITILSRCQRFDFRKITTLEIVKKLKKICDIENIKITDDALMEIASISDGGMRDAESLLDQVIGDSEKEITLEDISSNFGTISAKKLENIVSAIIQNNSLELIEVIRSISFSGIESSTFLLKMIELLKEMAIEKKKSYDSAGLAFDVLKDMIFDLNKCLFEGKSGIDPYILIEITLLTYVENCTCNIKLEERPIVSTKDLSMEKVIIPTTIAIEEEIQVKSVIPKSNLDEFIRIRTNNCLVNAKKDCLSTVKKHWTEYTSMVKLQLPALFSLIIDVNVVAASADYLILTHKMDTSISLLDENHIELETIFNKLFESDYKIVVVSQEAWDSIKVDYGINIKSGYIYTLEEDIVLKQEEKIDDIEVLANEIFGENCIEIM